MILLGELFELDQESETNINRALGTCLLHRCFFRSPNGNWYAERDKSRPIIPDSLAHALEVEFKAIKDKEE